MIIGDFVSAVRFIAKQIFIVPIKLYQICISSWLPGSCRYSPSCSQYTVIAINKYGIIRGLYLGVKRVLRCHPWGNSGYDPVP